MEQNSTKYVVSETVIGTKAFSVVGVKKGKDGKVVYLDKERKRILVTFALNPNQEDTNHTTKFLEMVVTGDLGKKLKDEHNVNLLVSGAFVRAKYAIQDGYKKDSNGHDTIASLYRVLVDIQVYNKDSKTWSDWLIYPSNTTTTPAEDPTDSIVDDDDLPF